MNNVLFIIITIVISASIIFSIIVIEKSKSKKIMNKLDGLIDAAINGTFRETDFDESMLSALENRFARYLSSSVTASNKIKDEKNKINELIADISHQTKTPISNLLLYTELLQEEKLSQEAMDYVNSIHSQSEKLKFLIDSLVKVSRLENNIISLNPINNSINNLLLNIEHQYKKKAEQKNLELKILTSDLTACFDEKWTNEALGNIVDNAIKYTDVGSVFIEAVNYELFIKIDVKDTGKGIYEEDINKIFSRFYRSASVNQMEGTGLGLYLAREIITKENGYIQVSSEKETGSVFSIFLPK